MATAGTMRFAPTVRDMGTIVHTCTVGSPARSSSFTIVAPQRVQVPQVDVSITAWTPSAISSFAIVWANLLALATEVPLPTVA